ncbi:inositol monophosphatase family protein [Nocardioides daphniae]|nr:inositol monophosphatase family protein [Nocardioides daphniae]
MAEVREHQGACVARLLPRVRDIRRAGSCALDLCHLAEGLADAYVEEGPRIWDWAAGALVLTEAGGSFALLEGHLGRRLAGWSKESVVVASTPSEWDGFVADLRETGFLV